MSPLLLPSSHAQSSHPPTLFSICVFIYPLRIQHLLHSTCPAQHHEAGERSHLGVSRGFSMLLAEPGGCAYDGSVRLQEFNELVNMSADELEAWLKTGDSTSSGWQGGSEDGETVGAWHRGSISALRSSARANSC